MQTICFCFIKNNFFVKNRQFKKYFLNTLTYTSVEKKWRLMKRIYKFIEELVKKQTKSRWADIQINKPFISERPWQLRRDCLPPVGGLIWETLQQSKTRLLRILVNFIFFIPLLQARLQRRNQKIKTPVLRGFALLR